VCACKRERVQRALSILDAHALARINQKVQGQAKRQTSAGRTGVKKKTTFLS